MGQGWTQTLLPLLIMGAVFAWRFRAMGKPRPFRPGQLWVLPIVMLAICGLTFVALPPPGLAGWAAVLGGLAIGAAIGWQRARFMHLDRDPASGQLQIRQSPAGLFFLLGIIAMRRVLAFGAGVQPGAPNLSPHAAMLTDGLLGLAVGMVVAMRIELWLRARAMPASFEPGV